MSLHPRLSIDAMSTFAWSFDQDLVLWRDVGARHAGLLISKLDRPDAQLAALDEARIGISTLIVGPYDLVAPDSWDQAFAGHRAAIDLAAAHGGQSIYFTPGRPTGAPWQEDFDLFAEAVAPTVAYGRQKGVRVAIEPTLRYSASFVNNLRDAIDVAERTGVALVVDFANLWMERDFRETFARALPHVALVQIDDVVIGGRGKPATGGRAHIGEGELPLRRLMGEVLDAGYDGVFDLEVVAADFTKPVDEGELRRGIAAASVLLTAVGA